MSHHWHTGLDSLLITAIGVFAIAHVIRLGASAVASKSGTDGLVGKAATAVGGFFTLAGD